MSVPEMDPVSRYQRRERIRVHPVQVGIDFVRCEFLGVAPPRGELYRLRVVLIPDDAAAGKNRDFRARLSLENVRILESDESVSDVTRVRSLEPADAREEAEVVLLVEHDASQVAGVRDKRTFTLQLAGLAAIDHFFSDANFSFAQGVAPSRPPGDASAIGRPNRPPPTIDYQTRDYAGYRQLMLDRLAVLLPDWRQRHPEDETTVLVELLAYAADHLSYYQDAVATEAYLGTSRQRISLRRHAKLLGRAIDEGCNARVWLRLSVRGGPVELPAGTTFVGGLPDAEVCLSADEWRRLRRRYPEAAVFETLHSTRLHAAHNEMEIYDWMSREFRLPAGTTGAVLEGDLSRLRSGDVLILEEAVSPRNGAAADRDPNRRQAVRVIRVRPASDPLNDRNPTLWQVDWHPDDALEQAFEVSVRAGLHTLRRVSRVRGNVVLADHGRTVRQERIPLTVSGDGAEGGHLLLAEPELTFRAPYDHSRAVSHSANAALPAATDVSAPAVRLSKFGQPWRPCQALWDEGPYCPAFVVEMDDQRRARLRFGDGRDGLRPRPDASFEAVYRVGGGRAGNLGRDAIRHVVAADRRIFEVCNPLPARGGRDPEKSETIREATPRETRRRTSIQTPDEVVGRAKQHPEVLDAAADYRWSGAWWTTTLVVVRRSPSGVDASFRQHLLEFLEPFRVAGVELDVRGPARVPLEIELQVEPHPDQRPDDLQRKLEEAFSNRPLGDNRFGLFHPEQLRLGQSLHASELVSRAMRIAGVKGVRLLRFRLWSTERGRPPVQDVVRLGRFEQARVDNDPTAPHHGLAIIRLSNRASDVRARR